RAGPNRACELAVGWVAFQRHAAFRTIAGLVALNAFAHRTVVFGAHRRPHVTMVAMMPVMTEVMVMRRVSGLLVTMIVRAATFLLGGGGSAFCRRMLVLVVHTSADGAAPKGLHFFRNRIDAMPLG